MAVLLIPLSPVAVDILAVGSTCLAAAAFATAVLDPSAVGRRLSRLVTLTVLCRFALIGSTTRILVTGAKPGTLIEAVQPWFAPAATGLIGYVVLTLGQLSIVALSTRSRRPRAYGAARSPDRPHRLEGAVRLIWLDAFVGIGLSSFNLLVGLFVPTDPAGGMNHVAATTLLAIGAGVISQTPSVLLAAGLWVARAPATSLLVIYGKAAPLGVPAHQRLANAFDERRRKNAPPASASADRPVRPATMTASVAVDFGAERQISRAPPTYPSNPSHPLKVVVLDPAIEETIRDAIVKTSTGHRLALAPYMRAAILRAVAQTVRPIRHAGVRAALITQANIQFYVRALLELEYELSTLKVINYDEIEEDLVLQPLGFVRVDGLTD